MNRKLTITLTAAVLTVWLAAPETRALTWSGENVPTPNTLVLYHLNGTDFTVTNSGTLGSNLTLAATSYRSSSPPLWMDSPSGGYLEQPDSISLSAFGLTNRIVISPVAFSNGLTISFWFRYRGGETNSGALFWIENPGLAPRVQVVLDNGGSGEGRLLVAVTNNFPLQGIANTNWNHFALTFDPVDGTATNGGLWKSYLNASNFWSSAATTDYQYSQISFSLGKSWYDLNVAKGVDYDELLIENAVLTDFTGPNGVGGGGDTVLDEYDITGVDISAGTVSVDINTTSNGVPYSLIYTTNILTDPQPLGSGVADTQNGNGGGITLQDGNPADPGRIYWIRSN